jgi:periplasmic divalent cation tolerance protein
VTDELCEVVITAPDADWLADFTLRLVEDHLAASAHNPVPGRSFYRWHGELIDRTEARATVRTRSSLVPKIVDRLNKEHPYEIPGVIARPIVSSSPAYAAWLLAETKGPNLSGPAEPQRRG